MIIIQVNNFHHRIIFINKMKLWKKIVRLTERDLTRLVKQIIKESNGDELEELKNDIDDICEEYQDEVKQMVKRNGSLNLERGPKKFFLIWKIIWKSFWKVVTMKWKTKITLIWKNILVIKISNFISFLNETYRLIILNNIY